MHESLKRPLFKKKAMEVYMAKHGGKVPKYVFGALIKGGLNLARAGFRAPITKKTFTGLETIGAGAGAEESRRALMGEESVFGPQPASLIGGLSTLYGGTGLLGRTLPKAFPGSVRAAGAGEAITRKTPFPIPVTLLGFGAGSLESNVRGEIKEEKESRIPQDRANALSEEIGKLGQNPRLGDVANIIENFNLTDKQINRAYQSLQIPKEDIASIRSEFKEIQTKPKVEATQVLPTQNRLATETQVQDNIISVTSKGSPAKMTPEEQDELALKNLQQTEKANKNVNMLLAGKQEDTEFNKEFQTLRNQIMSATGNNDMTNLVLMQLAAGLLTGKTNQRGVAGFADVLGQSAKPAIETAMILALKQKEFDNELALALLKRKEGAGTKIAAERKYLAVSDPNDPIFKTKLIETGIDKDTGLRQEIVKTSQGETVRPYVGNEPEVKLNEKEKSAAKKTMNDAETAIEFARIVSIADDRLIGPGATAREFIDSIFGAGQSYASNFPSFDQFAAKSFNEISDAILDEDQFRGLSGKEAEKARAETSEILATFRDESSKVLANLESSIAIGDQERIARARLGLIEQRMKYIVANANKAQDRLTAKDIESAAKRTEIFPLFLGNPKKIKNNYTEIGIEMDNKFKKAAGIYVANGGSIDSVRANYGKVPAMINYEKYLTQQDASKKVKAKDKTSILESI